MVFSHSAKSMFHYLEDLELSSGSELFRGESVIYRCPAWSTLSRRLETNDPELLRDETFKDITNARKLDPSLADCSDDYISTRHQIYGSMSNFVDFTRDIWVALYFACSNGADKIGRIWRLLEPAHSDLRVVVPELSELPSIVKTDWESQRNVLVQPETGVIPRECLEEICRIPPCLKPELLEFLRWFDIDSRTMFPEIFRLQSFSEDSYFGMVKALRLQDMARERESGFGLDAGLRKKGLGFIHPDSLRFPY